MSSTRPLKVQQVATFVRLVAGTELPQNLRYKRLFPGKLPYKKAPVVRPLVPSHPKGLHCKPKKRKLV